MDKRIIIVGGSGTFGLSAAWYLAQSGYGDIVCLDKHCVPSTSSAGFDRNKIVRTEYGNPVYTALSHEALSIWRRPIFREVFHQTGWLFGTDGSTELNRAKNFEKACQNTRDFGGDSGIEEFPNWDEGKAGFRGIYNANAGWVSSKDAMLVIKRECERLGVQFVTGVSGCVVEFVLADELKEIIGVKTADGLIWRGDTVILAAGAYCDTLMDFEGQVQATGYAITEHRMTESQYQRYKDMPVININQVPGGVMRKKIPLGPDTVLKPDRFPPNDDQVFKICNLDTSYITTLPAHGSETLPQGEQPQRAAEVTRKFTRYILPEFEDWAIASSRMCWDMECEAHDHNWILGYHPMYAKSLFIATGGSGHSFKNIVNVGKYIVQGLECRLEERHRDLWRWRPDQVGKDEEAEERGARPKIYLTDLPL